jgi:hypothetical protein
MPTTGSDPDPAVGCPGIRGGVVVMFRTPYRCQRLSLRILVGDDEYLHRGEGHRRRSAPTPDAVRGLRLGG